MPIAIPDVSSHAIDPRDMRMHTGHMLHGSRASVFDLPGSTRPGGVRGSGREGKTKNKKQRGPSPRMPTDLVQEGCNGHNGHVTVMDTTTHALQYHKLGCTP